MKRLLRSAFKSKRKKLNKTIYMIEIIKGKPVPKHIGIIMDGNGRWAEKEGTSQDLVGRTPPAR